MSEHEHKGRIVRKEIEIAASQDAVFEAWVKAEKFAQWFVDRASGDAVAGEVMEWTFDNFGSWPVPYAKVDRDHIVMAGEIPGRPPFITEILLESAEGRTILRLLNSGFGEGDDWDEEYAGVDSGWSMALGALKIWLENYAGLARTHTLAMRPRAASSEAVQQLFVTADGLRRWWGDDAELSAEPLTVGATVKALGDTGEVVVRTQSELLLHVPSHRSVVGFKCFPVQGKPFLALDLNQWGEPEPAAADWINAKADRLAAAAT